VKIRRDDRSGGRRGLQFRSLPLWAQWVLPLGVAAVIVVALVLFVNHETNDVPAVAGYNSAGAVAEQHREDTILVAQQQAPHRASLARGESAAAGLRRSIVAWMNHQINIGAIDGPIKHASCGSVAGGTGARQVFRCRLVASAQNVAYPFDGVVQPATGAITWCQRIAPPVPSMNVPVSRRCT
jgi:hypothetical protein